MKKQKYVGKSLDDALDQASRDLGADKENLSYNIVPSEGGSLFKKLLFKTITIEAWVEKSRTDLQEAARRAVSDALGKENKKGKGNQKPGATKDEARDPSSRSKKKKQGRPDKSEPGDKRAPEPKAQKPKRPRTPPAEREPNPNAITFDAPGVRELLEDYTANFLKVFGASLDDARFESSPEGDISVDVKNDMLEDLLARSDRLSAAYEHVFKRLAQKKLGDISQRLSLNSGDAQDKRVENLEDMARSMAEKVRSSGRSITLNAMSGQERRVIHLTIDELEGVATRSVGTGDGRKLVIYSTEKRKAAEGEDGEGGARARNSRGRRRSRSRRPRNRGEQGETAAEAGSGAEAPASASSESETTP